MLPKRQLKAAPHAGRAQRTSGNVSGQFDKESADGDEKIARVQLSESIGVEPSPEIAIDLNQDKTPCPALTMPVIDELVDRAIKGRPDLQAQAAEIRAADQEARAAKSEYRPTVGLCRLRRTNLHVAGGSYGELARSVSLHGLSGSA